MAPRRLVPGSKMTRLDFSFDKPSLKTIVTKWTLQSISPPDRANNTRWLMNLLERWANLQRPGTEAFRSGLGWAQRVNSAVVKENEGLWCEYELYWESILDTTDVTRTEVRKSLTWVQRDPGGYKCYCHIPHAGFCTKEKIEYVGGKVAALPKENLYRLNSGRGQHKMHQAGLHTVTKTPKLLKETARSTKSNMCCSNYRYIQPSNKNNWSHTV